MMTVSAALLRRRQSRSTKASRMNICAWRHFTIVAGGLLLWAVSATALATQGSPAGIDQSSFVSIGGIDQWISIQGEDRRNPVLLVVHGGPGESQWPMAEKYKPWQKSFTVVQWDQRGAGHSYSRYGAQTPDVRLERIAKDGVEVARYLCRQLGKKKIIVLGHSWGSIVAIRMLQLDPHLFAAYVRHRPGGELGSISQHPI